VYIGDLAHRYAVFDYTGVGKGKRPREFLGDFSGYLHAVVYGGNQLYVRGPIREVACWPHALRKLHDGIGGERAGATHAPGMIQKLFHLEQQKSQLDDEKRLERS